MPDALTHYAVSLLVSTRAMGLREALVFSLLGLAADVDVLLGVHRWVTHSLVVAGVALVAIYFSLKALKLEKYTGLLALAGGLYVLHILVDLLHAPTPVLYPLTQQSYWVEAGVDGYFGAGSVSLAPFVRVVAEPVDWAGRPVLEAPLVSQEGLATALALAVVLLVEHFYEHGMKR